MFSFSFSFSLHLKNSRFSFCFLYCSCHDLYTVLQLAFYVVYEIQNPCYKVGNWAWTEVGTSDFIAQKFGLVVEKRLFHSSVSHCKMYLFTTFGSDMTLSEMKVRHSTLFLEPPDLYKVLCSLPCQTDSDSHMKSQSYLKGNIQPMAHSHSLLSWDCCSLSCWASSAGAISAHK